MCSETYLLRESQGERRPRFRAPSAAACASSRARFTLSAPGSRRECVNVGLSVAGGAELAEGDHEGAWRRGERAEAEAPVEGGGLLVDCVHRDGAHGDLGRGELDA